MQRHFDSVAAARNFVKSLDKTKYSETDKIDFDDGQQRLEGTMGKIEDFIEQSMNYAKKGLTGTLCVKIVLAPYMNYSCATLKQLQDFLGFLNGSKFTADDLFRVYRKYDHCIINVVTNSSYDHCIEYMKGCTFDPSKDMETYPHTWILEISKKSLQQPVPTPKLKDYIDYSFSPIPSLSELAAWQKALQTDTGKSLALCDVLFKVIKTHYSPSHLNQLFLDHIISNESIRSKDQNKVPEAIIKNIQDSYDELSK